MNQDDLIAAVQREPYVPVRLTRTRGKMYDVTHTDGINVNRGVAAVAVGETIAIVSTPNITDVTPIPIASK